MIYRLYEVNHDKFLLFLVCSILFVTLFIMIFEIYSEKTGGPFAQLVSTFTPISFIILGTIVTQREIKKRKRELEHVYDKLKRLEGSCTRYGLQA